ncbi:MAG: BamA/TamA family outer membrane protein [Candidatus Eisenbacteria bacterium]
MTVRSASRLLAVLLALAADGGARAEDPRVGEIHILRKDVFNPSVPRFDRFPYSWANALHVRTREEVIREALLFRPGDAFDPELLDETERNLRRLSFVAYASVVPAGGDSLRRDVVVETHDMWSTQFSLDLGKDEAESGDGESRFELKIEEQNLFGFGKRVELLYRRTDGKNGFGWLLFDPQLFGSRVTLRAYDRERSPGRERGLEIERPFYSLESRWGAGGATAFRSGEDRLFRRDTETGTFFHETRWSFAHVGRMAGERYRKLLLRTVFVREETDYSDLRASHGASPDSSILEAGEKTDYVGLSAAYGRFRFVEDEGIDFFDRVEDIERGAYAGIGAGPLWGSPNRWRLVSEGEWAGAFGGHRYGSIAAAFLCERRPSSWGRTSLGAAALYHERWAARFAVAARALWEEGWRLNPGRESFVDGPNGLRGYEDRSDAGSRRLLVNVENRFDTGLRLLTVALGLALFFDAGGAWDEDEPVRFRDVRSSAGAGLRLGLTKSKDGRTFRIDLARNLQDGSFRLDAGLGHLFLIGRPFTGFTRPLRP